MAQQEGLFANQKTSTSLYNVYNDWKRFGFEYRQLRSGPGAACGGWQCVGHGIGIFADIDALAFPKLIPTSRAFITDRGTYGSFWIVLNGVWYPEAPIMGNGTPEAAVAAPVGSLYRRLDGGASTTLYVKESGTGNTGWVAK